MKFVKKNHLALLKYYGEMLLMLGSEEKAPEFSPTPLERDIITLAGYKIELEALLNTQSDLECEISHLKTKIKNFTPIVRDRIRFHNAHEENKLALPEFPEWI